MDILDFLTGPFVASIFLLITIGVLIRGLLFWRAFRTDWGDETPFLPHAFSILGRRWALSNAQAVTRKPVFIASRYLFHFCLIAAPLGAAGHVELLEDSFLGWSWPTLPQVWVDGMCLLVLSCILWVLAKRLFGVKAGKSAQKSGYLLSGLTGMAFLTAFLAAVGWFDYEAMLTLHILSGGALLLSATFLVCRSTADPAKCVGCAACVLNCPTAALEASDEGTIREFKYFHHRCIYCASCVASCPEGVVSLRHGLGLKTHYRRVATIDRSSELERYEVCSTPFMAQPLLDQINGLIDEKKIELETTRVCERCKKRRAIRNTSKLVE